MLESLFLSRWGGYVVMLAICGAVVLLLRALFGPRGLFRDPAWDRRNQEIRAGEAAAREARLHAWRSKYALTEEKRADSAENGLKSAGDTHEH
ncbi:MAG: hypothetical protein J1E80_00485 [Desulfovibrionaceae bacterium]|nr:hypothetical protein [Desulfovibrionaceae bacterium]